MPITFDEAKKIAEAHISSEGVIQTVIEKPYGWFFSYQSKEYVETGDYRKMWIGSGGFIVEKANGRVFEFGSAYPLEENFRRYEMGLKYERYDLVISVVINLSLAIEYLLRLDMTYVIPEQAYGRTWRIPQHYTPSQIREKLQILPCVFAGQSFYFRIDVIEKMQKANCLLFSVMEHKATP